MSEEALEWATLDFARLRPEQVILGLIFADDDVDDDDDDFTNGGFCEKGQQLAV